MLLEHSGLSQLHRQIQANLSSQRRDQALWTFPLDDPGQKILRQRFNVNFIRHLLVSHDSGGIAVHQHHFNAFFSKRAAGLRSGVIEFCRLTDDDGA